MSLKTSRADAHANVQIDQELCSACGLCVSACKQAMVLHLDQGRIRIDQQRLFGCIGCGHCMTICPTGAIRVEGRDLHPQDVVLAGVKTDFEHLEGLLLARRSTRHFRPQPVEAAVLQKILDTAATAPMGYPPSDVGVLVFSTPQQVKAFRDDLFEVLLSMKFMTSPVALKVMRPFMKTEAYDIFSGFLTTALKAYIEADQQGEDLLLYGAPAALYFYGSPYSDDPDPVIAATYAMLIAETLGLGSCMLGIPAAFLKQKTALQKKYGLPRGFKPGVTLILGYPRLVYRRGIRRRFARTHWVGDDAPVERG